MAQKKRHTKAKSKKKKKQKNIKSKYIIAAISLCLALAIIVSVGVFTTSSRNKNVEIYEFCKEVSNGIDVSEHNGEIDWESLKGKIDFAFIRVGYRGYITGDITEDLTAKDNIAACEKAGIPYGVYFYSQATNETEAKEEAEFALKAVKKANPQLPIVIDFEYAADDFGNHAGRLYDAKLSRNDATDLIKTFCKTVTDKGKTAGVYASSSVLAHKINTKKLADGTVIWAADYNSEVSYDISYNVWQYSKTGELDAVSSKYVDMNYWYKEMQ